MFVDGSYIVSSVVKSPSGGKNPWKTADANPRMSLFKKCFKSWFDTVRWWEMSCAFEIFRNYWFRCFLHRVMVILLQEKNFGPNVIYFVAGHWRASERVQVHPNVSRYTPSWKGPSLSYPINYYKRNVAKCPNIKMSKCPKRPLNDVLRIF